MPTTARIVLADDDEALRAIYVPWLRALGHTVWEASDGRQALALVRAHQPDLLLLDLWMPQLDGFQVLEALRYDPLAVRLKILMFSVQSDAESRLESLGTGAIDYIVKGASLPELAKCIERLLSTPSIPEEAGPEPVVLLEPKNRPPFSSP